MNLASESLGTALSELESQAALPGTTPPSLYTATKTYGTERGYSCAFRQHKADSHCSMLHGYALGLRLEFACTQLDSRGWVIDFGALKSLERHLKNFFDHKTVIAHDDPCLKQFRVLHSMRACDLVEMSAVGCEAFARFVFEEVESFLSQSAGVRINPTAFIKSVTVFEHASNAATYSRL